MPNLNLALPNHGLRGRDSAKSLEHPTHTAPILHPFSRAKGPIYQLRPPVSSPAVSSKQLLNGPNASAGPGSSTATPRRSLAELELVCRAPDTQAIKKNDPRGLGLGVRGFTWVHPKSKIRLFSLLIKIHLGAEAVHQHPYPQDCEGFLFQGWKNPAR